MSYFQNGAIPKHPQDHITDHHGIRGGWGCEGPRAGVRQRSSHAQPSHQVPRLQRMCQKWRLRNTNMKCRGSLWQRRRRIHGTSSAWIKPDTRAGMVCRATRRRNEGGFSGTSAWRRRASSGGEASVETPDTFDNATGRGSVGTNEGPCSVSLGGSCDGGHGHRATRQEQVENVTVTTGPGAPGLERGDEHWGPCRCSLAWNLSSAHERGARVAAAWMEWMVHDGGPSGGLWCGSRASAISSRWCTRNTVERLPMPSSSEIIWSLLENFTRVTSW